MYREFDENWPCLKYSKLPNENYTIPHLGQRKLLIGEVDFLTEYYYHSDKVVYAGAGPGVHIEILATLFPKKMFYLYDPREFYQPLYDIKNVKITQDYFKNKDAKKFKKVLFISDIRTSGTNQEEEVEFNLKQQKIWCDIMKPMASLKFRLPFGSNKSIEYYDGIIRLQPWVGIDSAETRLWTDCKSLKKYSCTEYEEKMFYFNKNLRAGDYDVGQQNMDKCNDCCIEWCTWLKYVKLMNGQINEISTYINNNKLQNIKIGPHCMLSNLPLSERRIQLAEEINKFVDHYKLEEQKKEVYNKPTKRN